MAKSKLTPDYIEWVMSLNANQALREIHKVNEESKELSRQQNAARQAIVKLEAEGKKGSKEWQNLKKSVKDYGEAPPPPSRVSGLYDKQSERFLHRILEEPL